jgi:hypothetical protein
MWPTWYKMLEAAHAADVAATRLPCEGAHHPHEIYRWTRNPPALDPRSTFSAADSIVEEDDD